MRAHRCAIEGCFKQVRVDKLMCLEHWRCVPGETQREVYNTWRAFKGRNLAARRPYLDAVERAVKEAA